MSNFKAKPSKARLDLKVFQVEWSSSSEEAKALHSFLNEIQSRRAFEINRGMALEEPVQVLESVVEFRSRLRDIANDLPHDASQERIVILTAIDWAGEILDAWHLAVKEMAPNTWEFTQLPPHAMMEVMESVWPMIETVRVLLDKLSQDVKIHLKRSS